MKAVLDVLNRILWGTPSLALILCVGILLSVRSGFSQFRLLPKAWRHFQNSFHQKKDTARGISGYKALCTALSATVGTGNIAGVAGAIALGGPGVIFWMWICAFLGMVIKFAEVTLAVHFRTRDYQGQYTGGPMYMIQNALSPKFHFLSYLYCFFGVVASFGIGNAAQVNAVVTGLKNIAESSNIPFGSTASFVLGSILAVLIFLAFRKGTRGISNWAEKLVPAASVLYILLASCVLVVRFREIPSALISIISGAFHPRAVTGGVVGSLFLTLRMGISRGIFTNEAGMGTASIAHASADVQHPIEQGLMGIMEVFLDTILICTLTALVILCSGVQIQFGTDSGIALTLNAFAAVLGNWSRGALTVLACIFAFATILGWGLYGCKCAQYLFGEHSWKCFVFIQAAAVIVGAVMNTAIIWNFSEMINALMVLPNLIALTLLTPVFLSLLRSYMSNQKAHSLK